MGSCCITKRCRAQRHIWQKDWNCAVTFCNITQAKIDSFKSVSHLPVPFLYSLLLSETVWQWSIAAKHVSMSHFQNSITKSHSFGWKKSDRRDGINCLNMQKMLDHWACVVKLSRCSEVLPKLWRLSNEDPILHYIRKNIYIFPGEISNAPNKIITSKDLF